MNLRLKYLVLKKCCRLSALVAMVSPVFSQFACAAITGFWEFEDSANLGKATIGADLIVLGTSPTWSASATYGGRTLTGVIDTVVGVGNHLTAAHGIAPNGGGTKVNQYSMLFDFRKPTAPRGVDNWKTLFQTDTSNTTDGDYFVRDSDQRLGVGDLSYTPNYQMPADTWERLVITADLTAGGAYRSYINGTLVHTHNQPASIDTTRFSLDPTVLLFGDEDGENGLLSVGAIAMWDRALTAGEVAGLGVAGNFVAVPEPCSIFLVVFAGAGVAARYRTIRRRSLKTR